MEREVRVKNIYYILLYTTIYCMLYATHYTHYTHDTHYTGSRALQKSQSRRMRVAIPSNAHTGEGNITGNDRDRIILDSRATTGLPAYQGRASVTSVKNFQLEHRKPDNKQEDLELVCLCGKIDDYTFNLDYSPPFTGLQAFAVAISQFDT